MSLMLPEPLAVQEVKASWLQVQVAPVRVEGIRSVTDAPIASLGPKLLTTIV